jgi:hypothetical protein
MFPAKVSFQHGASNSKLDFSEKMAGHTHLTREAQVTVGERVAAFLS